MVVLEEGEVKMIALVESFVFVVLMEEEEETVLV